MVGNYVAEVDMISEGMSFKIISHILIFVLGKVMEKERCDLKIRR